MVQVENEYGSYSNDKTYLAINQKLFREAGFNGAVHLRSGADLERRDIARIITNQQSNQSTEV